ncbi:DUF4013 domain-containing protein [Halosegnis marinus]|uniref:DUF4013 domain-containing protein n=1 Tax=Halosegnis marinus TaxID=3034023 RepID=UPI0036095519
MKSVIIGGVLLLFSVLLLPVLPVYGYFVRAAKAGADGTQEAPAFDDWGDLLVDGVKALVVGIVYFLIPTAVLVGALVVVGVGSFAAADPANPATVDAVASGIGVVGGLLVLVAMVLYLVATYVFPAGLVSMARGDDIASAFDFGTVLSAAFSADYFVAGVLAILLSLVVGVATVILGVLTLGLFFLLGVFVQFYVQVAFFYLFGRGYAKALDLPAAR